MTTHKTEWLRNQLEELCELTKGNRQDAYALLIAERLSNIGAELYETRQMLGEIKRQIEAIQRAMP